MNAWSGLDQWACLFLAAEIASSMRGRALASEVLPFSFREVQGADERLRQALLASYVDSTVLRDVIERHDIRQPVALRPLQHLQQASGAEQVDLVVLNPPLGRLELPAGVRLVPAVEWLLEKV